VLECLSPSYGSTPATATAANGSSSSPGGDWDGSLGSLQATEEQAVLLHIVAAELAAVPAACPLPGADSHRPAQPAQQQGQQAGGTCCWLACVVQLLALVWQQAVSAAPASAGVCKQQTPVAHVLEATLQVGAGSSRHTCRVLSHASSAVVLGRQVTVLLFACAGAQGSACQG
jgi:hypothetical protein